MQRREEYVVFRKEVKAREKDENGDEKELKRVIEHKARIVTYVDEKKHQTLGAPRTYAAHTEDDHTLLADAAHHLIAQQKFRPAENRL